MISSIFTGIALGGVAIAYFLIKKMWKTQEELKQIKNIVKVTLDDKKEAEVIRTDSDATVDSKLSEFTRKE